MPPPAAPRVLHVAQPTTAGVARVVAQLAAWQHAAGHDVHVACPPDGDLRADLTAAGVPVHDWPATRSPGPSVPAETRRLAAVIAAVDPTVVHLHSAKAGLAGRLALRGRRPTVFQPHGWSFDAVTGVARRGALLWERRAVRWTRLLVTVSAAEQAHGEAQGVRAPTLVVPNGVDVEALIPADDAERTTAREALGLHGPTVVCVGRLARQKGQDVLLAAWPQVLAAVPDARLLLVGDGPERAALEGLAAGLAGVALLGNRSDVAFFYATADVVALPSRWEGMALTPLEAMARARPVVVSDVIGAAESVPPGAGALVTPDDPAALATALVALLVSPEAAHTAGAFGRVHVQTHHDVRVGCADVTRAVLALT